MMTANEVRESYKKFFEGKGHKIVASAPMVIKDDPTLMFTNAGMNQWKDIILGTKDPGKDVHRKRFKTAVCLAVVLHENDIPDFNHLRIIFVDEFTTGHFSLFLRCARVYMDLCTGTTWPRISHFPEIL